MSNPSLPQTDPESQPPKLTPRQRQFLQAVAHWQYTDVSLTWWQMDASDKRIAKNLFHRHLIIEHTNQYHRRGLALTPDGCAALGIDKRLGVALDLAADAGSHDAPKTEGER